jgi:hypothetical protein
MPSTRSQGEKVEQPVSEPERLLSLRRRNLENQTRNNQAQKETLLPKIVKEPAIEMAEGP